MGSNYINRGEAIEIQFPAGSPDVKPAAWDVGDPISIGGLYAGASANAGVVGGFPAVAMTPRTAESTKAAIWTYGKYRLRVSTAAAIGVGTILNFLDEAEQGVHLSATDLDESNSTFANRVFGTRWGYALEAASAGAVAVDLDVRIGAGP